MALLSALGLGLSPVARRNVWRTARRWLLTPFAVHYWRDPNPPHSVLDEVAGYLTVALICPFMTA